MMTLADRNIYRMYLDKANASNLNNSYDIYIIIRVNLASKLASIEIKRNEFF